MLKHVGYLHGVTDHPERCPSFCCPDEYRYYYDLGRRVMQGTLRYFEDSATRGALIELGQLEKRIAS
jgi:hypothetical protein